MLASGGMHLIGSDPGSRARNLITNKYAGHPHSSEIRVCCTKRKNSGPEQYMIRIHLLRGWVSVWAVGGQIRELEHTLRELPRKLRRTSGARVKNGFPLTRTQQNAYFLRKPDIPNVRGFQGDMAHLCAPETRFGIGGSHRARVSS